MKSNLHKNEISVDNNLSTYQNRALVIALLIVSGVAFNTSPAFAENYALPFRADFEALPIGPITLAGDGIATHLGKFDMVVHRLAASVPSPSDTCVGFVFIIVTMTAANGDELWMEYTDGEICFDFTDFPNVSFIGAANFVGNGGTGRFSDSIGDYQMLWSGEITPLGVTNGGVIEGVIGY